MRTIKLVLLPAVIAAIAIITCAKESSAESIEYDFPESMPMMTAGQEYLIPGTVTISEADKTWAGNPPASVEVYATGGDIEPFEVELINNQADISFTYIVDDPRVCAANDGAIKFEITIVFGSSVALNSPVTASVPCTEPITPPADMLVQEAECGDNNDTIAINPAYPGAINVAQGNWADNTATYTLSPGIGYGFPDGTQTEFVFTDEGKCQAIPMKPIHNELCGANNDWFTYQTQPEGIAERIEDTLWQNGKRTLTFEAEQNYYIPSYTPASFEYFDSDTLCPDEIPTTPDPSHQYPEGEDPAQDLPELEVVEETPVQTDAPEADQPPTEIPSPTATNEPPPDEAQEVPPSEESQEVTVVPAPTDESAPTATVVPTPATTPPPPDQATVVPTNTPVETPPANEPQDVPADGAPEEIPANSTVEPTPVPAEPEPTVIATAQPTEAATEPVPGESSSEIPLIEPLGSDSTEAEVAKPTPAEAVEAAPTEVVQPAPTEVVETEVITDSQPVAAPTEAAQSSALIEPLDPELVAPAPTELPQLTDAELSTNANESKSSLQQHETEMTIRTGHDAGRGFSESIP